MTQIVQIDHVAIFEKNAGHAITEPIRHVSIEDIQKWKRQRAWRKLDQAYESTDTF